MESERALPTPSNATELKVNFCSITGGRSGMTKGMERYLAEVIPFQVVGEPRSNGIGMNGLPVHARAFGPALLRSIEKRKLSKYGGVAQLARAFGLYPECHRFDSCRRYHARRPLKRAFYLMLNYRVQYYKLIQPNLSMDIKA